MNDTPTPRVDALEQTYRDTGSVLPWNALNLARDLERQLAEATRDNASAAKSKAFDQIMAWDHGDPSAPKAIRPVFMPQGFHNKPTQPID